MVRKLALSLALLSIPSLAYAQVAVPNKWDSQQRTIVIDSYLPVGCDQPTFNARDHLRAVEPAMQVTFTWVPSPDSGPDDTTIIGRASYGYAWQTDPGRTAKTYTGPGLFQSYGQLIDTDVFMNHDLFFWPGTTDVEQSYDFWCDQASQGTFGAYQIDYQSVILHEIGHAVGFEHRTDATSGPCVMHPQQARGAFNRILCADEQTAYRNAY